MRGPRGRIPLTQTVFSESIRSLLSLSPSSHQLLIAWRVTGATDHRAVDRSPAPCPVAASAAPGRWRPLQVLTPGGRRSREHGQDGIAPAPRSGIGTPGTVGRMRDCDALPCPIERRACEAYPHGEGILPDELPCHCVTGRTGHLPDVRAVLALTGRAFCDSRRKVRLMGTHLLRMRRCGRTIVGWRRLGEQGQ